MDIFHAIIDLLKNYGVVISLVLTWAAIGWVYLGKRAHWMRKEFMGHVNFSLNYIVDGKLAMRTLAEVRAADVWLNDLGVNQVRRAADRTTSDQPFVWLSDPADMAFVNRAVLNVLSERFSGTYVAQSMGLPVETATYWFAITMERYDDMRTLKLRVLLVKADDLETVFAPENPVAIPSEIYRPRLQTLRSMHRLHLDSGKPEVPKLGHVVLGIVK